MKKELSEDSISPGHLNKFDLFIASLCGLLILAHFFSSFFPNSRLWGINHLAYFPLWTKILFTALGLSVLFPWVNTKVYRLFEEIISFLQKIFAKKEVIAYASFSLVFMFLFWLMRTRTHFLGDGYLYISELASEKYLRIGFEPLEIFSHLYIYKFLRLFFLPSSEFIYAGLSTFAGAVFIFILFFLARTFSEDKFDRLTILSLFLFSGATQLFLGYAEHYTLIYVSIFAYLYFSIRYLQGKTKALLPVILFALSTGFHFSSIYLLPSLFFLFIIKRRKGEVVFAARSMLFYFAILIFLFGVFIYYIWTLNPALTEIFVPLLKGRAFAPGYTLFSFSHLLDMLNQHLLLSPAGIILLLSLVMVYKSRIKFKEPIIVFLIIASIAQLFYHFLVDPKFGGGRDWDLFSSVALGYTFLGIYLFINLLKSKRYPAIALILTAFISVLPWFMLNANTEKGIDRYRNLLNLDLKRSLSGRYTLAIYYFQHKGLAEVNEVRAEIFKLFPEDSLNRAAKTYLDQGDYDKAVELSRQAIELNPEFYGAYNTLGIVYLRQGNVDKALEEFQKVVRSQPYVPAVHMNIGYALLDQGRLEEALAEFKKAAKLGGEPDSYANIGDICLRLGKTEEALKAYKKTVTLDTAFTPAHYGLGQIYLQSNSLDDALSEFNQVVRLQPTYAPAYYYLALVYSRKGSKEKVIEEFELFLKYSTDETQKEKVRGYILKLRSSNP